LLCFRNALERRVRIVGTTARVAGTEADFASRPHAVRPGAWTPPQSCTVADRARRLTRLAEFEAKPRGGEAIPRPPHGAGCRVRPDTFAFVQGRPSRLHHPIACRRDGDRWHIERPAP
jgi:pyridoxamine 5'-phosphate oxidase